MMILEAAALGDGQQQRPLVFEARQLVGERSDLFDPLLCFETREWSGH
jgi:hypothetical protein